MGYVSIKIGEDIGGAPVRGVGDIAVTIAAQIRKRLKLHSFSQPPVYPGRVALPFDQSGGQLAPHSSQPRYCASCAKWLENDLHRPRTTPTLAELLTEENVEAVAALNLYSQYDEDLAERDRRQRLILAWRQARPTGRLQ